MLGMLITWFKESLLRLDGERFDLSLLIVALQLLLVSCDAGFSILLGCLALSILVRFLKGPRNEKFLSILIDGLKEVLGYHFLFLQVLGNVVLGYINEIVYL
jgi:H+/gluconate symporter-like permease